MYMCIYIYIYIYKYMYAPHAEHCATWNRDIEQRYCCSHVVQHRTVFNMRIYTLMGLHCPIVPFLLLRVSRYGPGLRSCSTSLRVCFNSGEQFQLSRTWGNLFLHVYVTCDNGNLGKSGLARFDATWKGSEADHVRQPLRNEQH